MLLRCFHENVTYQAVYLYILLRYLFREQTWRCTYFGVELTFVAGIFSAKVSLILDYPFPVLFLFNWKRVSFILSGIAWKSLPHSWSPFLQATPGVLVRSLNSNITRKFYVKGLCFHIIFPFLVTMVQDTLFCNTLLVPLKELVPPVASDLGHTKRSSHQRVQNSRKHFVVK